MKKPDKYEIKTYGVDGKEKGMLLAEVEDYDPKYNLPILNISMMSDEKWHELAREQTLHNYRTYSGMGEAPDYETALMWEKEYFGLPEKNWAEIIQRENKNAPATDQSTHGAKTILL